MTAFDYLDEWKKVKVFRHKGGWRVTATHMDDSSERATFHGPRAEVQARDYAVRQYPWYKMEQERARKASDRLFTVNAIGLGSAGSAGTGHAIGYWDLSGLGLGISAFGDPTNFDPLP